jgi:hypothetical protein
MLKKKAKIIAVLLLAGLIGCSSSALYVANDTVIGINAAVNTQRTAGHIVVGYDRNFATLVPISVDDSGTSVAAGRREAMSVISCSKLEIGNIFLKQFTENLLTGKAALKYAQAHQDENLKDIFSFPCRNPEKQQQTTNSGS